MKTPLVIAVLEWNSSSGQSPIVLATDDAITARRAAIETIAHYLPTPAGQDVDEDDFEEAINDIDREWVQENPLPDLNDDAGVTAWLDVFKEETTDLWLTVYEGGSAAGETFEDRRTP
jgi:hypothetical protein